MHHRPLCLLASRLPPSVVHARSVTPATPTLTPVVVSVSRANTELQDAPQTLIITDSAQSARVEPRAYVAGRGRTLTAGGSVSS